MEKILNPNWATLPMSERIENMLLAVVCTFEDEKRNSVEFGGCVYRSRGQFAGCAIGMFVPEENCKIFDLEEDLSIRYVMLRHKHLLPEWMTDMPLEFLTDLQEWHDISYLTRRTSKLETILEAIKRGHYFT